jgi:5-methylcytosine-specific restriction protein A
LGNRSYLNYRAAPLSDLLLASKPMETDMTVHAAMFRDDLERRLAAAERAGRSTVEVTSGDLHREVGGYPGRGHRMPICCDVMRARQGPGDAILLEPPKGRGATLTIRYSLPRNQFDAAF